MASNTETGTSGASGGVAVVRGVGELGGQVGTGNGEGKLGGEGSGGVPGGASSSALIQASPYLSQSHPTSAAPVIPVAGAPVPSTSNPVYDPRFGGVAQNANSSYPAAAAYSAPAVPAAQSSAIDPSNTIVVSGLPRDVTVERLAKYFGEFGALKMDRSKDPPAPLIAIQRDTHPGGTNSIAWVQWEDPGYTTLAVEYFNGKHWAGGGTITVTQAKPVYEPAAPAPPPAADRYPAYPGTQTPYNANQNPSPYPAYPGPSNYNQPPQQNYAPPPYDARAPPPSNAYEAHPNPQNQPPPPGYAPTPATAPQGYDPSHMRDPRDPREQHSYDPYAQNANYANAQPPAYSAQAAPAQTTTPAAYPTYPDAQGAPTGYGAPRGHQNYNSYSAHQGGGYPPYHGGPPAYSNEYGAGGYQHYQGHQKTFRGKGGAARAGDWICPSCHNNNFTWRTTCKQCHIPRPLNAQVVEKDEIPGDSVRAASRPPHPESYRDWICPRCNFKNFAKREYCHDCKAPRPPTTGAMSGPVRGGGMYEQRSNPY